MEKNQHNNTVNTGEPHKNGFTGDQPGQQPPTGTQEDAAASSADTPEEKTRHSESSFPQQDGETLGTP